MTNYQSLPETARIWIYQSSTPILAEKFNKISSQLQQFTQDWTAHSQALRAFGTIKHERFILLMVDESQAGASGCSIDKSVRFIQFLEEQHGLSLMDRMTFTFEKNGKIQAANREEFAQMYQKGELTDETIVFDNLVKTKGDFEVNWRKKLGESWHKRMV